MLTKESQQRQLAVKVATSANELEREALLAWADGLLEIKNQNLSAAGKAKKAIQLTASSKVILPAAKIIGREIKRLAWDERGTKSRMGLIGVGIGATVFGGQGAGVAALGTAVGVPLWVVLGAGGAFAGMLIEELTEKKRQNPKTTYTVVDAEKEETHNK